MTSRILVSTLAAFSLCAGPLAADPILSLNGPASPVAVGSSFMIDVSISDVADLVAYQFDVGFDPAFAAAGSVMEGPFLSTAGPTLFIPGAIDNLAGTVSFTAGVLAGMGPGATGSGVLASLQFSALQAGTGNFFLLSPLLYDSVPDPIDVTTSNLSVTAVTTTVPEPSAAWLLALGLAALGAMRRGSRKSENPRS